MPNYTEIVADLQLEVERLTRMRETLDKQIDRLLGAIKAVGELAQESDEPIKEPDALSPDEEQGFTNQVRAIFKANPVRAFTPVAIRNILIERDPELDPKITLIHTHNTLKRLLKQDEIAEAQIADGHTGYKLKMKPVIDLMAALRESLSKMEDKKEKVK